jgi:hypothetical protein
MILEVSPIISKIFEMCLVKRLNKYLYSSNMQFGFKKESSCAHAIYTVQSTVEYFTANNSTISICSLDLSKAFDKVNLHILFVKLMDRKIPINILLLLDRWYSKSYSSVKWLNVISQPYKLTAGVRQGGVLSPFLFAIYVDDLLNKLNSCALGCYINHLCFNAIMYADDLILLSLSILDLQPMINICITELESIDMVLNINKSVCIRIGKRKLHTTSNLLVNDQPLKWHQEISYLGVTIQSANKFKCNLQRMRQKYFRSLNSIYGKVGTRTEIRVLVQLLNSFCVPLLTYATEAITLYKSDYSRLEAAYSLAFSKIFNSYNAVTVRSRQFHCGSLLVCYQIDMKKINFLQKLAVSNNSTLKAIYIRCGFLEFHKLKAKYNLSAGFNKTELYLNVWKAFELSPMY